MPGTAERLFAAIGALSALCAVAAGAFGAHALRGRVAPELLAAFETGSRYQMVHALALFALAWWHSRAPSRAARAAGWLFVAGSLLFAGSLYALTLTGMRWLGAITPVGGVMLLLGWGVLAWAILRSPRKP